MVKFQYVANTSSTDDPVSIQIVKQLADVQGLDPRDLSPLTHTIDPEALDTLIESAASDPTVLFLVNGYDVTVTSNGIVSLDASTDS